VSWESLVKHSIAAQIVWKRLEAGLTQADVARIMGKHRPVVAREESGKHWLSLHVVYWYASVLGCDVRELLWPLDAFGPPPGMVR